MTDERETAPPRRTLVPQWGVRARARVAPADLTVARGAECGVGPLRAIIALTAVGA
jgi:hypothetical protein